MLDFSVEEEGRVTLDPSGGSPDRWSQITATTEPGYSEFDNWSCDVSGTDNQITITMDSDKSVTANFSKRMGDVNGDTIVDIVDALQVARHAASLSPSSFDESAADVKGCDGKIDIVDALEIAR